MTEAEWLTWADPSAILRRLKGKASDRKLRLFMCACCRVAWDLITTERSRRTVGIAELFADGAATEAELEAAARSAEPVSRTLPIKEFVAFGLVATAATTAPDMHHAASVACHFVTEWGELTAGPAVARRLEATLLRDIFGNPFVSPASSPAFSISNVVSLAQMIYDERAFERMPDLADTLERAGCTDTDILDHCRQPGPHVRGCWAIDLLLGRS